MVGNSLSEASAAVLGVLLCDLADVIAAAISAGDRPLIIGGDHSTAISLLGNEHGMPLAALLSLDDQVVTKMPGPALDPVRIVVIGMYNNEPAEVGHLAVLEEEGLIKIPLYWANFCSPGRTNEREVTDDPRGARAWPVCWHRTRQTTKGCSCVCRGIERFQLASPTSGMNRPAGRAVE